MVEFYYRVRIIMESVKTRPGHDCDKHGADYNIECCQL